MKKFAVSILLLIACGVAFAGSQGSLRIKNDTNETIMVTVVDSYCMKSTGNWGAIAPHTISIYRAIEVNNGGSCWLILDNKKFVKFDFGHQETAKIYVPGNIILVRSATNSVLVRNKGVLDGVNRKTLIIEPSSNAVVKHIAPSQPEAPALAPFESASD